MTRSDVRRHWPMLALLALLWGHVAAFLAAALVGGQDLAATSMVLPCGIALAAAATGMTWHGRGGSTPGARLAMAFAVASMASLSGILLAGTWAHLYGEVEALAMLLLVSVCLDWRMIALAAASLLTERAIVGWAGLLPGDPGGDAWPARIAILLVTAGMLIRLTREIATLQAAARAIPAAAEDAAAQQEHALRLASEAANELAAQAAEDRVGRELEYGVGGMVSSLVVDAVNAARAVQQAVAVISEVTAETAGRSAAIVGGSQEASASAQILATSVDKLAVSIGEVSGHLRGVSDTSFLALENAVSTNQTVQNLAEATKRIGVVTRDIGTIARRTNMLALNAAIEAARAGEAGRGFNVVANEVKDLAQQTAKATKEIENEIDSIVAEMDAATVAITGMAQTVAELGGLSASAAGEMEEQTEIARVISESATRAAAGTETVMNNLQGLTEIASRSDHAVRDGARDAERLADTCNAVQDAMQNFVKTLMAG